MMKYIYNPNLPEGKVKSVICGTNDKSILDFFQRNDISVINIEKNSKIDEAVSFHADIAAIHLGDNVVIIDKNQTALQKELQGAGFNVYSTEKEISGDYPQDIALNFAFVGNHIIGNFRFADKTLSDMISSKKKIEVKQGYCKCSVLIVDENSVITDDESIHRKMSENGIDSLFVSKGDISLPGHEYGFIGGSSGKISKETIIFFGDVRNHRDFKKISEFITNHGCKFICTDSGVLRDIGGFISITEE